jgi:quercetin dioxygenase-like cupin family protein
MNNFGFSNLDDLPLEKVSETFSRRSIVGDQQMVSWVTMSAGSRAKMHRHPHEQLFWVLSGCLDVKLEHDHKVCRTNDIVLVRGNMEHEVWCLEDTKFVTILSPPRKDLMAGAGVPGHIDFKVPE